MPEEVNRVLTDRCSDLLLLPSRDAADNLVSEGIDQSRFAFVGNVMIDTLLSRLTSARERAFPAEMGLSPGDFVVATLHRPSNVDEPTMLESILDTLDDISHELPLVFPVHPRTRQRLDGLRSAKGDASGSQSSRYRRR